jgi:hypothetical protein
MVSYYAETGTAEYDAVVLLDLLGSQPAGRPPHLAVPATGSEPDGVGTEA